MKSIIAALIQDRTSYDKVRGCIEEIDLDINGNIILKEIDEFYAKDRSATQADKEVLLARVVRKHSRFQEEFERIFNTMPDVSTINIVDEFLASKMDSLRDQMLTPMMNGDYKRAKPIVDKWYEYMDASVLEKRGTAIHTTFDISGFVKAQRNPEFKLRPDSISQAYGGGADRGEHIIIFGRPNKGKSLITLNMVAGWINDGHKVLYVGNEDRMDKLVMRLVWRLSGMTKMEALDNPAEAEKRANARGLQGNLVFMEASPGTISEITAAVEEHEPDIIVIDQIRNLDMRSDGMTEKLEAAAMAVRNIAKYYKLLAISITQAWGQAADKLVLTMEDIDSSKTGIQATADLMIGVGSNEAYDAKGLRELSTPKNKEGDDHFHATVRVNPLRTKVSDV